MIRTRIASPDEGPQIQLIRELSFATVRKIYRPNGKVQQIASEKSSEYLEILAEVDDSIAGVVGMSNHGTSLNLHGLAVLPVFRKRGAASALIGRAAHLARENGCTSISLFTIRETGNVSIFKRLGFSVVSENVADWCESKTFQTLHETEMVKLLGQSNL